MTRTLLVIRLVILSSLPYNFHFQYIGVSYNDNHCHYFKLLLIQSHLSYPDSLGLEEIVQIIKK